MDNSIRVGVEPKKTLEFSKVPCVYKCLFSDVKNVIIGI